ncbi:hypothetical protein BC831DRAFT_297075 [Entophlyctis helioformis]|nr:hypothetical protein BC831DRAFT_297075 [Entophlyctis helioformis]
MLIAGCCWRLRGLLPVRCVVTVTAVCSLCRCDDKIHSKRLRPSAALLASLLCSLACCAAALAASVQTSHASRHTAWLSRSSQPASATRLPSTLRSRCHKTDSIIRDPVFDPRRLEGARFLMLALVWAASTRLAAPSTPTCSIQPTHLATVHAASCAARIWEARWRLRTLRSSAHRSGLWLFAQRMGSVAWTQGSQQHAPWLVERSVQALGIERHTCPPKTEVSWLCLRIRVSRMHSVNGKVSAKWISL